MANGATTMGAAINALTIGACFGLATVALAQESPKDVIAAHVRAQGYKCDAPKDASRDVRASRPGEAAWILSCEDARYRVRLIPDMAAIVETL